MRHDDLISLLESVEEALTRVADAETAGAHLVTDSGAEEERIERALQELEAARFALKAARRQLRRAAELVIGADALVRGSKCDC